MIEKASFIVDKFCFAFFLLEIQGGSDFINLISQAVQKSFIYLLFSGDKCGVRREAVATVLWRGWCSGDPPRGTPGGARRQRRW